MEWDEFAPTLKASPAARSRGSKVVVVSPCQAEAATALLGTRSFGQATRGGCHRVPYETAGPIA